MHHERSKARPTVSKFRSRIAGMMSIPLSHATFVLKSIQAPGHRLACSTRVGQCGMLDDRNIVLALY